ncbi:acetylcholine receptor subunit beta-type unc-29-like [Pecten maximus]|uniref:acetylcholine receptor subunit beta-type unc-29-like n=1 Tax=Pecten maximus TaxID=6579 RepID=UPI0014587C9E|nr:acetylcholine receptor subunit beta-type unc-29-like [Pecten maximus]
MLNSELLTGYNPSVHPGHQYSGQLLNVNASFMLRKIQTFDELTSTFAIVGVLSAYWYDERLDWTPTNYNDLKVTHFKLKEIWTPPFVLGNSQDDIDLIGNGDMHVAVTFAGVVNWLVPIKISTTCDADVTYYPFDQQSCVVLLLPWGYDASLIQLNAIGATLDLTNYAENPIWNLVSTSLHSAQTPSLYLGMRITFKRKSMFFVMNFILPTILMCFINVFVFILPAESGERVGFCITVLLAIAVFLSIVSSALPQTSTPQMAILCYLLVVHIVLSIMIMICTICGLRFHFRSEEDQVPSWIARLTRYVGNVRGTNLNRSSVSPDSTDPVSVTAKTDADIIGVDTSVLSEVSWKHVSTAFNRVCFVFFIVTAMSCNIAFLFVLSVS